MQPNFRAFFQSYVEAYNRSLKGPVDLAGIRSHFSDSFIAAGPQGVVTGDNDEHFVETLKRGYAFYREIGTRHLTLADIDAVRIDANHYLATIGYQARYDRGGDDLTIPFEVSYLLEWREGELKIFAFIAGDEMALYRRHGLLNEAAE